MPRFIVKEDETKGYIVVDSYTDQPDLRGGIWEYKMDAIARASELNASIDPSPRRSCMVEKYAVPA